MNFEIHFLDRQNEFDRIMESLATMSWIGFDTEFVGEKTYIPVLCLIQVVTEHDIYLIDPLKIRDLSRFLSIIKDPAVLKITHAGDNDYRLLYTLYGTVPKNTFDTQIAAGFVGYNYPAGFGKICERELRVSLAKSHTVADWEARPIEAKALDYAVEDVKYLPALHQKFTNKLRKHDRESWVLEENKKWENPSFYEADIYREALSGDFIHQVEKREKLFLLRIYIWRREKAAEHNVPKENILQNRHISSVVKAIKNGVNGFKTNRTLHEGVWRRNISDWEELYKLKASPEEQAVLDGLPAPAPDDPDREWMFEFLYLLVKKRCLEHEISAALLLPKGDFNKLKNDEGSFDADLLGGWRAKLLGPELTHWLKQRKNLRLDWINGQCSITMKN